MRVTVKAGLDINVDVDSAVAPQISGELYAILLNGLTKTKTLTDETTPDLQGEPVDLSKTLSGGTATIDLTAAPIAYRIGSTTDLTGKRLIAAVLFAPTTNVGAITVASGASNGYAFGTHILEAGETHVIAQTEKVSTRQAVAAGDKILDVTGTGTDQVKILAVFGDA